MGTPANAIIAKRKFHCECLLNSGETVYIPVKAKDELDASNKVHEGYRTVEYVLDILTPAQMDVVRRSKRQNR